MFSKMPGSADAPVGQAIGIVGIIVGIKVICLFILYK
nr:MAG TPA: Glycophorin A [Caudoviricetes sp.]